MILWIILFFLVVAIAFVLAAKSMRDFEEIPTEIEKYSLYLIRVPKMLNGLSGKKLLESIYTDSLNSGLAFSFERLIKGQKGALALYAPNSLVSKYQESLGLVEIEDYTNFDLNQVSAWEVGIKEEMGKKGFFKKFPKLLEEEQFLWQLIILGKKGNIFQVQIRAVLISADSTRRRQLTAVLEERGNLSKLLKASNTTIVSSYQKRSFTKETSSPLATKEILQLLVI